MLLWFLWWYGHAFWDQKVKHFLTERLITRILDNYLIFKELRTKKQAVIFKNYSITSIFRRFLLLSIENLTESLKERVIFLSIVCMNAQILHCIIIIYLDIIALLFPFIFAAQCYNIGGILQPSLNKFFKILHHTAFDDEFSAYITKKFGNWIKNILSVLKQPIFAAWKRVKTNHKYKHLLINFQPLFRKIR